MTQGRPRLLAPAIAASLSLALCAAAGADAGATRAEGLAHSEQHARVRAEQREAKARWQRLTPGQRAARIQSAQRETSAVNAALAERARDDTGYWEPQLRPLPEYAIHASVLPTGKVLIFGREPQGADGTRVNLGSARVFDPLTGEARHVPPPKIPENLDGDGNAMPAAIYCSGQALLSDGRVLLAGGNLAEPDTGAGRPEFSGLTRTFLFDPWTESWELGPQMSHGRWYPTLTKLPSGDVLIASGYDEHGQGVINPRMEIYRPGSGVGIVEELPAGARGPATDMTLPPSARVDLSLYPNMFVLPNANIALAGPGNFDSALLDTTIVEEPGADRGSAWIDGAMPAPAEHHYGGSPVLEPDMEDFDGTWDVLNLAGADSNGTGFHLARATIERLTAGALPEASSWSTEPSLNQARFYPNAVLLPDGGMVAVGGGMGTDNREPTSRGNFYLGPDPPPQLKQVELRRPGERTWRLGAPQQEWRTYHSVAALLPDGRVMSAGDDGHEGLNPEVPDATRRDSAEVYWPPYLFDGDRCALRPVIRGVGAAGLPANAGAPAAVLGYGERFGIFSEHAQPGMRAALVAPAAVTHSVDMNQRVVPLRVQQTIAAGGLNVQAPAKAAIAPPGHYMLFVVDAAGTPSQARWVRVLAPAEAAAARGSAAPASVTAAWPDPRGRSCTDPDGTLRSEPDPPRRLPAASPPTEQPATPPPPSPPTTPPPPAETTAKRSSKLALDRARIARSKRRLDVLAQISALATGRVQFELLAAGRRTRLTAPVGAGTRRIRLRAAIPAAQARLGSGILEMSYGGDARTRALSVRLRAARNPAALRSVRPSYRAGVLRASGRISRRARGVVRVQLQFEHDGKTETVQRTARIARGRWTLGTPLPAALRRRIAARSGTLDAHVLFTGDLGRRMRGEMRSYQVLGEP